MQGSFQVAQATGTGNSTNSAPIRIYKLTKPLTDQAVVINLGYDQKAKVDFTSIANEKITLIHVGEKLIILFDNQSTVTVEPFFDSRADGQGNITIETAPGRDISVQEFTSLFPISTDTSVLPAADNGGNSNGNAQASGADFRPFAVDPLAPPPLNVLAPQEELPPSALGGQPTGTQPASFQPNEPTTPPTISPPTISGGSVPSLTVDESFLTAATNHGVAGSGLGPAGATVATVQVSFDVTTPGGQQSLTYALSVTSPNEDSGLIDTATGQYVLLTVNAAGVVEGRTAVGGDLVLTVSVDATGHVTLTDLRAVHEGTPGDFNEGITLASGLIALTATVTDNNNQTASASVDIGSHLTILDDGPVNPTVVVSGVEPVLLTFDGGLAGGNFVGPQDSHDTNASPTVASVSFAGAFTFGHLNEAGADSGATTITYALQFHAGFSEGGASGLTSGGLAIHLYENGGVITGSTALTEGGITAANTVFTLSVDAAGDVTLTQTHAIDHTQTDTYSGSYINDIKQLAANLIDLKASAVTTDGDGDSSPTVTALLDLGGNIQFGDDGPRAPTVTVTPTDSESMSSGELLTFDGGLAGGNFTGFQDWHDTNPSATIATEDFSGVFTVSNTNLYGADGAGATIVNYTLGFHTGFADGSASGLTHAGSTIFLYDVGGVITGSTSATAGGINAGNTVFTLSVGLTTGIVTLTQLESIDHSQTDTYNGSYIYDVKQLAANLIDLTASAFTTDSDGDKTVPVSASIDIGHQIQFGDDGPQTPTVTLAAFTAPVLLTFDGGLAGGNFTGTQDSHDTNPSATVATEDFSGAFTIGNTNLYGADGAGATTINYTLGFHSGVADGVDSGLTHAGSTIFLYDVGGVITGSTSATAGGINAGNTVFTLSVGLTTGIVTLTQIESIDHSQTDTYNGSYINDIKQLAANLVDLTASAFTTDSEGDKTVTASALVDVGHQIQFGDDGPQTPTVTLAAFTAPAPLTFDGGLAGGNFTGTQDSHDTNASATVATEDFSGAFTIGNGSLYGADGAGSTTINYTLGLHAGVADGVASGLTHAGSAIFLYDVGGVITGSTSATAGGINAGNTVFTLSVGLTTGVVTLTQLESIDHSQTDTYNGSYINDVKLLAANLVDLTASGFTTDSEGDKSVTASATIDVGHQIQFGDDGPQTPTVTLAAFTAPALLTFDGGLAGGNFTGTQDSHDTNPSKTIATENFSGAFTISNTNLYGADGAGATTINYTLGLHAGVANGSASGLTHAGSTIFLYDVGGVITGSTSATQGGINAGNTVFTLSVGLTTGIVTLTQLESIDHSQTDTYSGSYINDVKQLASNLIDLTASAFTTDSEGDKTVTASALVDVGHQIQFGDDGPQTPTVTLAAFTAPVLLTFDGGLAGGNFTGIQDSHDTNPSKTVATENFSGAFTISNTNLYGADGAGATTINYALGLHAGVANGSASELTHAGSAIFLYFDSVSGVVTGSTSATVGGINAGNTVFTLSVGLTTGIVTLTQFESIDHSQIDTYSGSYINDVKQLAANLIDLKASAFTTDHEGDKTVTVTASASASIDIGHQIEFGDDGPKAPTVTLSGCPEPVLLTFDGGLAGGNFTGVQDSQDTNPSKTIATEDFSGAFTISNTNLYGADGAGATTVNYTLGLHSGVANGSASGLTHAGSTIFLYLDSVTGVVTGSTSATVGGINAGNTVFTLSVGLTTGIVTLTQLESIDHSQTNTYSGSYINDVKQLAANLIDLKASAFTTDSEGDKTVTASALVDVGHQIQFGDDGPQTPTVTLAAFTAPVLLTFDGGLAGGNFTGIQDSHDTNPSKTVATENFSGAFTISNTNLYGADGAGATTINYALGLHAGVANGSASGLTHAGSAIFLYFDSVSGVVTGSTSATVGGINAGNTVFTLSVGLTTGIVTLTQFETIDHSQIDTYSGSYINDVKQLAANLIDLTASAFTTDHEGHKTVTASAKIDIGHQIEFGDDGPKAPTVAVSAATVGVDETPGVQTTGGASDVLGSAAITFNGAANTVAGLFTTVASKGNDTDVPAASLDNGALSFASTGVSSILTVAGGSYGAAGAGTTTYGLSVLNAASGLTLTDGTAITLSLDGSGRIIGTVGTDVANPSLTGMVAFAIAIDPATGRLYVAEYLSLHQNDATNPNDIVSLAAGKVGATVTVTDSDGDHAVATADISTHISFLDDGPAWVSAEHGVIANQAGFSLVGDLQYTLGADGLGSLYFAGVSTDPLHPTATTLQAGGFAVSEYVDASGVLHGVANGTDAFTVSLDPTTSTYTFNLFHTLDSYSQQSINTSGAVHGAGPTSYAVLSDTSSNAVTILTGYHTSGAFNVAAWFGETHDTLTSASGLTQAQINASSSGEGISSNNFNQGDFMRFDFGAVGDNSNGDTWTYGQAPGASAVGTGNQISFTINAIGGSTIIDYVVHSVDGTVTSHVYNSATDGTTLTATGHGNIDYVELYDASGKSKVLLSSISELVNNGASDVPFTVGVKDGDGDAATGSFSVNVNGGTALSGTAGDDVIVAGSTSETLTGAGGSDKFVLNLSAHDIISDFSSNDLVLLDVAGLNLPSGASNALAANQFTSSAATGGTENNASAWNESGSTNKFFFNNTTHELWYSANGTGTDKVDLAHVSTGVPAAANVHIF
ncbi:DUF5801 repeats-in-toxin domain-containing protein [Bradyrhizobium sp. 2S1]|uniref:DUF5801 repeats-in-toxin domain-containing protein n=1 Tax=Bradyrhizobium sp. 2S1 TaxID=1404429 RepID=UPI0014097CC4|nr:DUF5801 repeats-in-toxin domain-containing protein [Bradyrhizobium sp. 2S1]MCK7671013.1 DUF5801 domain-containing protein [Bradyrhizobium sp. 2S1]